MRVHDAALQEYIMKEVLKVGPPSLSFLLTCCCTICPTVDCWLGGADEISYSWTSKRLADSLTSCKRSNSVRRLMAV